MEANQELRTQFSSAASTILEDIDVANKNISTSIDRKYQDCARIGYIGVFVN